MNNTSDQSFSLQITTEDTGNINPSKLVHFFALLNAASSDNINKLIGLDKISISYEKIEESKDIVSEKIKSKEYLPLSDVNEALESEGNIIIKKISFASPLVTEIITTYLTTILIILTVCGGEVEISDKKFKLKINSIADALIKLKTFFGLDQDVQASYRIKPKTIKLNKEEKNILMGEIKGQGGYQNFRKKLQLSLNQNTGELKLSDEDFAKIIQYARTGQGGYQDFYKNIFQRHIKMNTKD